MNDKGFAPAEVFSPGEYIKDELDERGWSQADLADILGRPPKLVSDIVAGKCSITPETAHGLGEAFGTSAQVWMNLDSSYRLWQLRPNDEIARRARLYAKGPIKEMVRRHFIESSDDLDVLEQRVREFFELPSLDDQPVFPYAARKSTGYLESTPSQFAWLFRARALARSVPVSRPYTDESMTEVLAKLRPLMLNPEDIRRVAATLGDAGIRLVIVEPLAGVKIDGVTFWLDDSSPVIALSMRYGRIDWLWFTLFHELDHVKHREGALDVQLVGRDAMPFRDKPAGEQRADSFVEDFEIPRPKLDSFILRVTPLYSKVRIAGFAATLGIHPGIVVGRLQHDGKITCAHSRDMLTDVRRLVVESTLTDGWGNVPQ
jgi:HTH-type transcriptional regulator / antitoxin HigA